MIKKLFCFLLSITVILGLTACKEKTEVTEEVVLIQSSSEPANKTHELGGKAPLEGLTITDSTGSVWFTASEIEQVASRYNKDIGRFLELVLKSDAKAKLTQAAQGQITEFNAVIGEETFAKFKIHTQEDGTQILIYADRKDPIMNCFNAIT